MANQYSCLAPCLSKFQRTSILGKHARDSTYPVVSCQTLFCKKNTSIIEASIDSQTARTMLHQAHTERYLYVHKAPDSKVVKRYDTQTRQWSELVPMHDCPGRFNRLVILNSSLYCVRSHNIPTNSPYHHMERFEPHRKQWRIISAPMHTEREGFELKVFQEKLYAVGGYGFSYITLCDPLGSASNKRQSSIVGVVEHYDEASSKWTTVASMNVPRLNAKIQEFKGKLYAIGGDPSARSVECYDPAVDRWTLVAPLNTPRVDFAVGILNDMLYVVGGYYQSGTFTSVECYDDVTNQWTNVAPMNMERRSHRVTKLNGHLYAVGGLNGGDCVMNTVERYDGQQWSVVAPMNLRRASRSALQVCQTHQGTMFAIYNQEPTDSGEWYDELTNQWTELITTR